MTVQTLTEAAEAMPMMDERTMVVVVDWDLAALSGGERGRLCAFLEDVPEWCCVVFLYDTVPYRLTRRKESSSDDSEQPSDDDAPSVGAARGKSDKSVTDLRKVIRDHVQVVKFLPQEDADLLPWIARRFKSRGKTIDRRTAEYLLFTCGNLMSGLIQEIDKIADYTQGDTVTQREIDAVADPVLSRQAFDLSSAVAAGEYDRAAAVLGDLLKMQTEPLLILGALGKELRQIYSARLALDSGKGIDWLKKQWGFKSDYPARLRLTAARQASLPWCADALRLCEETDRRLKSERGRDGPRVLKSLLIRLGTSRGKAGRI